MAFLLPPQGHAFEARLYAENPENDFLPAGGRVLRWRVPPGALFFQNGGSHESYVRVDSGVSEGDLVSLVNDLARYGLDLFQPEVVQPLASA